MALRDLEPESQYSPRALSAAGACRWQGIRLDGSLLGYNAGRTEVSYTEWDCADRARLLASRSRTWALRAAGLGHHAEPYTCVAAAKAGALDVLAFAQGHDGAGG